MQPVNAYDREENVYTIPNPWWTPLFSGPYWAIFLIPAPRGGAPARARTQHVLVPWRWLGLLLFHLTEPRVTWALGYLVELRRVPRT